MNDYKQVNLTLRPCTTDMTDLLAALLADEGYESFVPSDGGMTAYVPLDLFDETRLVDETRLADVASGFPFATEISWEAVTVEGQDWNSEWEKHYFKPIVVGDRCVIHSSFHTDIPSADYDIVIDPKMAFGTGHHATTSLIIGRLLDIDLNGLTVTDMGTGSGILAILAAMRGAGRVSAVEIDGMAYTNALENVAVNNVAGKVDVYHGDASMLPALPQSDLLLANINRNIIIADMPRYAEVMKSGAMAVFSGFYEEDVAMVADAAAAAGLRFMDVTARDRWASTLFIKS